MQNRSLIVGYGITGNNVARELHRGVIPYDIYDKKFEEFKHVFDEYDFIFICVDTPYIDKDHPCDVSAVEDVIDTWKDKLSPEGVFVIKSTVLPVKHNIPLLHTKYPHIVFSPEYYGSTQHCNNFEFDFTILGGLYKDCIKVQQLLQKVYDGRHTFRITDPYTACLAKYMENCYLAMKVSFCNQFANIAKSNYIDYESLRELFILDPRVNPSHTFVYIDQPYWDSHCLNKDVRAIAEVTDAELLKDVIKFNESQKNLKDANI